MAGREKIGIPAVIPQLFPDFLNVGVAHVLDAEDKDVLVLGDGFANGLEEVLLVFPRLLGDLGHVHDPIPS